VPCAPGRPGPEAAEQRGLGGPRPPQPLPRDKPGQPQGLAQSRGLVRPGQQQSAALPAGADPQGHAQDLAGSQEPHHGLAQAQTYPRSCPGTISSQGSG